MRIDNHQTNDEAKEMRKEIKLLLIISLEQQHAIRKRQIWNSVLLLLNFSVLAAILVLGVNGFF